MKTAIIKIRGRESPLQVSEELARKIKNRRFGNEEQGIGKAANNETLDLGDEWSGEYGQVVSIEFVTKKYEEKKLEELPMTPEQKQETKKIMEKMRIDMEKDGILPKRARTFANGKTKVYEISRSELKAYKEKHGKEYQLPENAIIIED